MATTATSRGVRAVLVRIRQLHSAHLKALSVALLATIFSAGLAFAGGPGPAGEAGLENAAVHAGKVLPVRGAQDETNEQDEESEETEETEETEESEEAGDNCATDPTALTDEELAALRHGSIVCWAAHQDTWPEEFKNHGQWVASWAKWKAPSDEDATASSHPGKGKAKGHANKP
jgi:hypothetical protein